MGRVPPHQVRVPATRTPNRPTRSSRPAAVVVPAPSPSAPLAKRDWRDAAWACAERLWRWVEVADGWVVLADPAVASSRWAPSRSLWEWFYRETQAWDRNTWERALRILPWVFALAYGGMHPYPRAWQEGVMIPEQVADPADWGKTPFWSRPLWWWKRFVEDGCDPAAAFWPQGSGVPAGAWGSVPLPQGFDPTPEGVRAQQARWGPTWAADLRRWWPEVPTLWGYTVRLGLAQWALDCAVLPYLPPVGSEAWWIAQAVQEMATPMGWWWGRAVWWQWAMDQEVQTWR